MEWMSSGSDGVEWCEWMDGWMDGWMEWMVSE